MRAALLSALLLAVLGAGCRKKLAEGTCNQDIDCKPGWKCIDAKCIEREKPPWEQQTTASPKAGAPAAPAAPAAPVRPQEMAPATGVPPGQIPIPPAPGQPYRPKQYRTNPRVFPLDT